MSSVGSSDGSNRPDETARRRAEEQKARDSEAAKRHKKEIRRMTELHYQEIEKLKNDHVAQIEEIKKNSTDSISGRDYKHNKEIEDMRDAARKQAKAQADENLRREETLRKATTNDSSSSKVQNEARINKLAEDYKTNLGQREKSFQQSIEDAREAQAEGLERNRQRLTKSHDVETKSLIDERNERVENLQRQMGSYRETTEMTRKERELQHMRQMNRASDNLMRAVTNEREARKDGEEILRDGFEHSVDSLKGRYEKATQKERETNNLVSNSFRSSTMDRIDNQVRRLESEKENLKASNTRAELQMKARKEQEIDNIRDSWSKNLDDYRMQRDQAVSDSNERTQKDVSKVRDQLSKELVDNGRFYRGRMSEESRIQRMAYENLVGDFESKTGHLKNVTDQRVKTIFDNSNEEKARLVELQKNTHIASQRGHQDEMKALREVMDNDKQQVVTRLQNQMRKQEVEHAERMNNLVQKYEKQILSMKDQILLTKRQGDESLKRTVDEMARSHKLALDQVETKNRDRMRQISGQQAEEIRQVNKRHEDKLDQVLVEVKKT